MFSQRYFSLPGARSGRLLTGTLRSGCSDLPCFYQEFRRNARSGIAGFQLPWGINAVVFATTLPPSPPHIILCVPGLALHCISYPALWHSLSFQCPRGRSPSTSRTRWLLFVRALWPVASILPTPQLSNGLTGSPTVVARGLCFSHVLRSRPTPGSLLRSPTVLKRWLLVSLMTPPLFPTAPPVTPNSSRSPLLVTLQHPQSSLLLPSSFRGSLGSIQTVAGLALSGFSRILLISSCSAPGVRHPTRVLQTTTRPQLQV